MKFDERGHLLPYEIIEISLAEFKYYFVEKLSDKRICTALQGKTKTWSGIQKVSLKFNFNMENSIAVKISGIVHEIKNIDIQLEKNAGWDDEVGKFMAFQFMEMKRELLKELVIELIRSNVDFSQFDSILNYYSNYLSQTFKTETLTPEIKFQLQEVEGLLAAA